MAIKYALLKAKVLNNSREIVLQDIFNETIKLVSAAKYHNTKAIISANYDSIIVSIP